MVLALVEDPHYLLKAKQFFLELQVIKHHMKNLPELVWSSISAKSSESPLCNSSESGCSGLSHSPKIAAVVVRTVDLDPKNGRKPGRGFVTRKYI